MNEQEIEKELELLPEEWQVAFIVRIRLHSLNETQHIKKQKVLFEDVKIIILFESLCTGVFVAQNNKIIHRDKFLLLMEKHGISSRFLITCAYLLMSRENNIKLSFSARELTFLKNHFNSGKTPADYLYQPLYASQSKEWLQRGQEFVQVLRDYGHGFDIWADWFQGRIDGVPTDKEFIEAVANLPQEILAQEPAQINAYLKNLCQTERPLNRVRVIFLGYGEAGKTSLIRALNGLEVVAGKEQMTPGIDISTWQVPGTEITAHFWDFGGQVVAHATHQFFLRSRCLYILLLDGRTEINANEQAEY